MSLLELYRSYIAVLQTTLYILQQSGNQRQTQYQIPQNSHSIVHAQPTTINLHHIVHPHQSQKNSHSIVHAQPTTIHSHSIVHPHATQMNSHSIVIVHPHQSQMNSHSIVHAQPTTIHSHSIVHPHATQMNSHSHNKPMVAYSKNQTCVLTYRPNKCVYKSWKACVLNQSPIPYANSSNKLTSRSSKPVHNTHQCRINSHHIVHSYSRNKPMVSCPNKQSQYDVPNKQTCVLNQRGNKYLYKSWKSCVINERPTNSHHENKPHYKSWQACVRATPK
eukprot:131861_1